VIAAEVIADSISPQGVRLVTIEATMHRFVLAELNTHRVFSRNSASSRAIPVAKQLEKVISNAAYPVSWPSEQPGMQGGSELDGEDLFEAVELWNQVHYEVTSRVGAYLDAHPEKSTRLHKSVLNRLLEPFMWHTVVVTATEWDGFWWQRCHPAAQPELRVAAEEMRSAFDASTPTPVAYGEWHLPYTTVEERRATPNVDWRKVSAARCARLSTLTQDGTRSLDADLALFARLADRPEGHKLFEGDPFHASPLEHVATPHHPNFRSTQRGNLRGYHQFRHEYLGGF